MGIRAALCLVLVAGCSSGPVSAPPHIPSLGDGQGLWPGPEAAVPFPDAETAVEAFIVDVAGVEPADVELDPTAPPNGPVVATVEMEAIEFDVLVAPLFGEWSVMQAGGGVEIREQRLVPLAGSVGVSTVTITYRDGDATRQVVVTPGRAAEGIPVDPETVGAVVAVYRNADHRVVGLAAGQLG